MARNKERFIDKFMQQRLPSVRLSWSPRSLIIFFSCTTVIFGVCSVFLLMAADSAYEDKVIYDGWDHTDSLCHIESREEGKVCTVSFTLNRDVHSKIAVYYELDNFYQNHREYINSVNYLQIGGEDMEGRDLERDCGSKTYVSRNSSKVLVPCGYIANSFFNDVFTLTTNGVILNEHDISYPGDRARFRNGKSYGKSSDKYQFIYETYKQIPMERTTDITKSNYYGGGVEDEHFIVWMRLAGVPKFRKLYGRLEGRDFKKGDTFNFTIENNFEVSSFHGRKALVLATENAIGGKNYGIGISFVIAAVLSILLIVAILIVKRVCPDALPVKGGKYD